MRVYFSSTAFLLTLKLLGCTADVEEAPDANRIEVRTPKVEVGDAALDANPATDDDLDVDTPLPGDS